MAARGQRVWTVDPLRARPEDDGDCPGAGCTAEAICGFGDDILAVYPSGLVLPHCRVNWVWWFPDEGKYRLGNAEQAEAYRFRRDLESPVAVPPQYLHGCQVREDSDRGYRFIAAVSFPAWCGV